MSEKNEIRDLIKQAMAAIGGSPVEDDAYGVGWNGDTTHAPSQNAVYDALQICLVYGNYTGDGKGAGNWNAGNYKAITLGGQPIYVRVITDVGATGNCVVFNFIKGMTNDLCWIDYNAPHSLDSYRLKISSDGFWVNDAGGNLDPNSNGSAYRYMALVVL